MKKLFFVYAAFLLLLSNRSWTEDGNPDLTGSDTTKTDAKTEKKTDDGTEAKATSDTKTKEDANNSNSSPADASAGTETDNTQKSADTKTQGALPLINKTYLEQVKSAPGALDAKNRINYNFIIESWIKSFPEGVNEGQKKLLLGSLINSYPDILWHLMARPNKEWDSARALFLKTFPVESFGDQYKKAQKNLVATLNEGKKHHDKDNLIAIINSVQGQFLEAGNQDKAQKDDSKKTEAQKDTDKKDEDKKEGEKKQDKINNKKADANSKKEKEEKQRQLTAQDLLVSVILDNFQLISNCSQPEKPKLEKSLIDEILKKTFSPLFTKLNIKMIAVLDSKCADGVTLFKNQPSCTSKGDSEANIKLLKFYGDVFLALLDDASGKSLLAKYNSKCVDDYRKKFSAAENKSSKSSTGGGAGSGGYGSGSGSGGDSGKSVQSAE